MTKKILITSALPYVNNVPHLGNIIGSTLSADVFARFNRSIGNETLYICGTDEHGTATETKAAEEGLSPQEICDKYYIIHKSIYDWFNISFDIFGRTSRPEHVSITQQIFLDLHKNGYIKEEEIEQLYCEKGEHFLADRFVEGVCPFCGYEDARGDQCDSCQKLLSPLELIKPLCKTHKNSPITKKTKHLFIDLELLQPELDKWVESQSIKGNWTQNAITTTFAWLKKGLEKRAITRDLKWGVKVPLKGYEDKVFYVWFDAPIGYISITSELTNDWKDWWKNPANVDLYQFMAKDNIPFHTIIFPAALIGTKEDYTKLHHINSTEYLNYEDGKFSKSRNVGVFGDDAKNSGIPSDAYRYYLLINRPENSDTTFTWDEFQTKINNELVANFGNFVNRTLTFVKRFQEGKILKTNLTDEETSFWKKIKDEETIVKELLKKVEIKLALKQIMKISQLANQFFQECAPWKSIKEDPDKCKSSLYILSNLVKDLAILIEPYLPETSNNIFKQLGIEKRVWDNLGILIAEDVSINEPSILFEKIEDDKVIELKDKFSGEKKSIKFMFPLDLKVGKIIEIKRHPDADKLYVEKIDLGDETRQIVSGLVDYYTEDELLGQNVVVVTNLETAKLRGEKSEGMILAAEKEKEVGILFSEGNQGDQITIEGYEIKKDKIDFKEFLKVKMKVRSGIATYEGKELKVNDKPVRAQKVESGNVC